MYDKVSLSLSPLNLLLTFTDTFILFVKIWILWSTGIWFKYVYHGYQSTVIDQWKLHKLTTILASCFQIPWIIWWLCSLLHFFLFVSFILYPVSYGLGRTLLKYTFACLLDFISCYDFTWATKCITIASYLNKWVSMTQIIITFVSTAIPPLR